jgi:ankyrin repeat protein
MLQNVDQTYPRTSRLLTFSLVQVREHGDGLLECTYHDYTEESNLAALHKYLNRLLLKHNICGARITVQGKLELFLPAIYKHQDYPPNCSTLTYIEHQVGLSCFGFDLLTLFAQFGFVCSFQWLLGNLRRNVNAQDSRGVEPLMAACLGGHLSVMRLLYYNFHANPRLYTTDRQTLLMVACQVYLTRREPRLSNTVNWLVNDVLVDVNEEDENGMTALHIAIGHSDRSWMHRAIINGTFIDEMREAREGSIHVNEEVRIKPVLLKIYFMTT